MTFRPSDLAGGRIVGARVPRGYFAKSRLIILFFPSSNKVIFTFKSPIAISGLDYLSPTNEFTTSLTLVFSPTLYNWMFDTIKYFTLVPHSPCTYKYLLPR